LSVVPDVPHISVGPVMLSVLVLWAEEEGTKLMLTGSEVPLNQLDSILFLLPEVSVAEHSLELWESTSNSAASFGEILLGEMDRSRECFRKGKNFGDQLSVSELSVATKGGRSVAVCDL